MRKELNKAIEAYNLAATPQPSVLFRDIKDDIDSEPDTTLFTDNRQSLLNYSIDMKYILATFLTSLIENHGERRAERLLERLTGVYLERYTYAHRQQIIADIKRLKQIIVNYRRTGEAIDAQKTKRHTF